MIELVTTIAMIPIAAASIAVIAYTGIVIARQPQPELEQ